MTENNAQSEAGLASDLNNELDSLLEIASDYLSSQKQGRFSPCNPDFLIKNLSNVAKRLGDYEKRLLWFAEFAANVSNQRLIEVFGECCCPMHVIQKIDDAMAKNLTTVAKGCEPTTN